MPISTIDVQLLLAGKSTLLQILGGKYMVGQDVVRILGRPAFHDLLLTSSGDLGYLGAQWRRDAGCAGSDVPIQVPSLANATPVQCIQPVAAAEDT